MSTTATVNAWNAPIAPVPKLALLALANFMNCDAEVCIGVARLCERCSLIPERLPAVLAELEAGGYIDRVSLEAGRVLCRFPHEEVMA